MQCPIDGTELLIAERSGVEIDYCPQCRGVWLDRGELDKIIERNSDVMTAAPAPRHHDRNADLEERRPKRKKKSVGGFLEDLFDF